MSTAVPRFIIIDDVDSSIHYTGPWFPDQGSQDSVGNFGPPYESTLHGTNANASLVFAFNGTQIRVLGTNNIRNDSGVLDPTWECFVDNISIGATAPFAYPENNWVFCNQDTLVDGPHVLTVNATVLKNQTFWFDDIQYAPSASVPLDQAAIMVDSLDPQLQYGAGWQALGDSANMTLVPGSIFTFDFIGVSLSWYGWVPIELPLSPSSASYAIDGQTPVDFTLKGIPANTSTTYNQKFFETPQLSAGPHTLKVVYEGNNSTPLTLDFLIVQNGTLSSTTTGVSSHATSAAVSTPAKNSTPANDIVGGVIGGLALIVFALLGFILARRRQRRIAQERDSMSTPTPFEYTPLHPSSATPSGGISYSPLPQISQMGSAVTKGQLYHASMPSLTSTDFSRSIEPPSTSSGVIAYPTNSHPVPLQQTTLAPANPSSSSSSPPASMSLVPSPPVLLPSKAEREAEALASLRPQRRGDPPSVPVSVQSNDTWLPNVVLHADSGVRMPSGVADTSVVDVPPIYTPD